MFLMYRCHSLTQSIRTWFTKGTGLKNAPLAGAHLKLSGYGKDGSTLEIFQYSKMIEKGHQVANGKGFRYIAFHVADPEGNLIEFQNWNYYEN